MSEEPRADEGPVAEAEKAEGTGVERELDEVKGAGWGLFWWVVAISLHLLAVILIVWFTPIREWFFAKPDPDATLSAIGRSRMQEIVRQLVDAHARQIRKAVAQQQEILGRLAELRDTRYERYVETAKAQIKDGQPTPTPEPIGVLGEAGDEVSRASLEEKGFFDLYDFAQQVEAATCRTYEQLRAAELARIQAVSLKVAKDSTNIAIPGHPALDKEVFYQDISSGKDPRLKLLKDEILKVRLEIDQMLGSAQHMLDMALGIQTADVEGLRIFGAGGTFEGAGATIWGSSIGPSLSPEEFFPGNTQGNFTQDFRPTPGRKLMEKGVYQADWMFIDTWYIIGPFPNPNRMNIDHKFPPESMPGSAVDLDATYVGKNGMNLTWKFRQTNALMQVPHVVTNYAIWYAYTEIYADRDQERWVIFGSDDYSRVWLNGEMIFSSGKTPHMWIPDRGWKKVRFRKGYNRMLLKIENAGGTMGYSVAVFLGDANAGQ